MKVSELTGADLALWVARAIGLNIKTRPTDGVAWVQTEDREFKGYLGGDLIDGNGVQALKFEPHEDWAQGGPLLDEHAIGFRPISDAEWMAEEFITGHTGRGFTPLIAAMRALVASKYGDEVPD